MLFLCLFIFFFFFLISFYFQSSKFKEQFFQIFECGYDSLSWGYYKIGAHFFKMGIIFILFDLEIMFLILTMKNSLKMALYSFLLIFILLTWLLEASWDTLKWG